MHMVKNLLCCKTVDGQAHAGEGPMAQQFHELVPLPNLCAKQTSIQCWKDRVAVWPLKCKLSCGALGLITLSRGDSAFDGAVRHTKKWIWF